MNLLFDFLKHLPADKKEALGQLKARGLTDRVWRMVNEQVFGNSPDKTVIQSTLGISPGHFDKITSGLLHKSYQHFFKGDVPALLNFLSGSAAYTRHFYSELNRQLKYAETKLGVNKRSALYNNCLDIIQANIPIASKDERVMSKLGNKYVALFKNKKKGQARLFITCKLLFVRIQKVFAAGQIKREEKAFQKKIARLGVLPAYADAGVVFEYYWTRMYFYFAIEKFEKGLQLSLIAQQVLKKFKSSENDVNLLRLRLRSAEFMYCLNRLEESFQYFTRAFNSTNAIKVPDRGYYTTKFLQVCLATGNVSIAENILERKKKEMGINFPAGMAPRDIISYIKFYLLAGQYDDAYRLLQLGFEKNPKGKYFQYELELRNLQTAYFGLTGEEDLALQNCNKNIKFLRFHGYGIRESDFPYFFILVKAILKKKYSFYKLTDKEQKMLQRYQKGTYAVYGKLLLKLMGTLK